MSPTQVPSYLVNKPQFMGEQIAAGKIYQDPETKRWFFVSQSSTNAATAASDPKNQRSMSRQPGGPSNRTVQKGRPLPPIPVESDDTPPPLPPRPVKAGNNAQRPLSQRPVESGNGGVAAMRKKFEQSQAQNSVGPNKITGPTVPSQEQKPEKVIGKLSAEQTKNVVIIEEKTAKKPPLQSEKSLGRRMKDKLRHVFGMRPKGAIQMIPGKNAKERGVLLNVLKDKKMGEKENSAYNKELVSVTARQNEVSQNVSKTSRDLEKNEQLAAVNISGLKKLIKEDIEKKRESLTENDRDLMANGHEYGIYHLPLLDKIDQLTIDNDGIAGKASSARFKSSLIFRRIMRALGEAQKTEDKLLRIQELLNVLESEGNPEMKPVGALISKAKDLAILQVIAEEKSKKKINEALNQLKSLSGEAFEQKEAELHAMIENSATKKYINEAEAEKFFEEITDQKKAASSVPPPF